MLSYMAITMSMTATMPTWHGGSFAIYLGAISIVEDALWS
jgi:hypothetical protein